MSELRLSKITLMLWKIRVTVLTLLLLAVLAYFCHGYGWFLIVILALVCLYEGVMLWYLPKLFRNYRIKYINGAVVIESGVVIKTTHIMPFSKMIYAETITSPLAKLMGIKALSLKAARSRILIPELPEKEVVKFVTAIAEGEL